jgi:hypothetical protein
VKGVGQNIVFHDSPFEKYFEYGYGAGKEAYWTSGHMTFQFEAYRDCI